MVNWRVLKYNLRCLANWCGDHRPNLDTHDAFYKLDMLETAFNGTTELHNIMIMGTRITKMFEECQMISAENLQFKDSKPVSMSDRPMKAGEPVKRTYITISSDDE